TTCFFFFFFFFFSSRRRHTRLQGDWSSDVCSSDLDMGTSWLLPRLIGASRSHELMLTGRRVDADEALRIGLVAELLEPQDLAARALSAAEQIAALSPWGVRLTKQGMWSALEIPSEQAAVEYEDRQQIMATFGRAVPEAVSAFLEKRAADFAD